MSQRRRKLSSEHQNEDNNDDESGSDDDDGGGETDGSTSIEEIEPSHRSTKRGRASDDDGVELMEEDKKLQRIERSAPAGKKKRGKRGKFKKHQG